MAFTKGAFHVNGRYTVVAGTPQKIVENILENIDVKQDGANETFLEDFLFTHIIFLPAHQLCPELMKNYQAESSCPAQDQEFIFAHKSKVVHLLSIWVAVIGDPALDDTVVINFIDNLKRCVHGDHAKSGALGTAVDMLGLVSEEVARYQKKRQSNASRVWKSLPNGQVALASHHASDQDSEVSQRLQCLKQTDDFIFRVHCADHTYCTLKLPLGATSEMIKRCSADKMGLDKEVMLVEVKSNGERRVFKDHEGGIPTSLSINGRIFIVLKEHLDALTALPDQDGPREGTLAILETFGSKELAYHITSKDWQRYLCIHEYELIYYVFGKQQFRKITSNLDRFLWHFSQLQYWVATEVCLTRSVGRRVQLLQKFIKLAAHLRDLQNMSAFFAVVMGLSNIAVCRLSQAWEKLPGKYKKMFCDFEAQVDPSRNHRSYRQSVSKMIPPVIPLVPLLIKDLMFTHEGNKTYLEGLVNFEKMHVLAETLRMVRICRSRPFQSESPTDGKTDHEIKNYLSNLRVIDNQRILNRLSQMLENKKS